MKQQFIVNTSDLFNIYIYEKNLKIVPTSATITVYSPGSDNKLVSSQAMTVDLDGLLHYSLTAADNGVTDLNYRAVITYEYDTVTTSATLFYDVVNARLSIVITDGDIVEELPQLKDSGWRIRGTAESGSTTTIVDAELMRYDEDYFKGGLAYSFELDETREVVSFDSATGTVLTTAFGSAIATDKYILTRSYTRQIERAFEKVKESLISMGKSPSLILDSYDLREIHLYYAVAEICKGNITEDGGFWWKMWVEYEKKAESALQGLSFKYDLTGDGYIADSEEGYRVSSVKSIRS